MKVFTGVVPFNNVPNITSAVKIMDGERPPRPTSPPLADDVWALVRRCWEQEPRSRPEMRNVLQDLTPILLRSLLKFPKSSPEFQVALSQFYDSTELKGCVDHLRGAELEEFINFLDDVSQLFKPFKSQSRL